MNYTNYVGPAMTYNERLSMAPSVDDPGSTGRKYDARKEVEAGKELTTLAEALTPDVPSDRPPNQATDEPASVPADEPAVRLNIGAGSSNLPGFTPIDYKYGRKAYPLDEYASNSVDEIYASHVLEHFSYQNTTAVLSEWARVLKPGGRMRIAVPNLKWIAEQYLAGADVNVQGYLMGGQSDQHDVHFAAFDEECLREAMMYAGLTDITPWTAEYQDCASLPVSLNLQGFKPARRPEPPIPADIDLGKDMMAIMSLPRLAFTDNMFCVTRACFKLRMELMKSSGVFWGQCLERMMEAWADAKKYILVVDYDTVFRPCDVLSLFRTMEDHPEIDALAPVQIQREKNTALFTRRDENGAILSQVPLADVNAELMKVDSSHFGLTIIRSASLKKVRRPWFWSTPAADPCKGSQDGPYYTGWGDGREDDDTYFWRKWRKAGLSVFQANHVPVGHMELLVTWPSPQLTPMYQKVSDWDKNGKPGGTI